VRTRGRAAACRGPIGSSVGDAGPGAARAEAAEADAAEARAAAATLQERLSEQCVSAGVAWHAAGNPHPPRSLRPTRRCRRDRPVEAG